MFSPRTICLTATFLALAGCAANTTKQTNDVPPPPARAAAAAQSCDNKGGPGCPAQAPELSPWQTTKAQTLADVGAYVENARNQGQPISLSSATASRKDPKTGKVEQTDALRNVVLRPLALDKITKGDKTWQAIIREFGRQAALANVREPMQIVISATSATRKRVADLLSEGIAQAKTRQKVSMEFFDTKQAKDTVIFFQTLDQKQFN